MTKRVKMTPRRWIRERREWRRLEEKGRKGMAAERAAERKGTVSARVNTNGASTQIS